jgi:hypothetical protein
VEDTVGDLDRSRAVRFIDGKENLKKEVPYGEVSQKYEYFVVEVSLQDDQEYVANVKWHDSKVDKR